MIPAIAIGIPSGESLKILTMKAVEEMVRPPGYDLVKIYNQSSLLYAVRGQILQEFLKIPSAQYLLMIDSDMVPPKDGLVRLLDRDVDMVSGLACRRTPPYKPVIIHTSVNGYPGELLKDYHTYGLHEVFATGCAFTLIKRHVAEAVAAKFKHPFFHRVLPNGDVCGEDVSFCWNVKDLGFRIFLDCDCHVGHLADYPIYPTDWVRAHHDYVIAKELDVASKEAKIRSLENELAQLKCPSSSTPVTAAETDGKLESVSNGRAVDLAPLTEDRSSAPALERFRASSHTGTTTWTTSPSTSSLGETSPNNSRSAGLAARTEMEDEKIEGAPETQETPAEPVVETETTPEPETTETPAAEETEPTHDPNSPEAKYWQGAYTRTMQDHAEERRRMKEAVESLEQEVRSLRGGAPPAKEEEPADSPIDAAIRRTKAYRELEERAKRAEADLGTLKTSHVATEVRSKYPELGDDAGTFVSWLLERPGIAAEIRAGRMSDRAAVTAFRAENPAKGRRATAAPVRKPIPKVEGASAPSGASRDIRVVAKERGISTFDAAVLEAKRDLERASQAG